jgi:iron-sulfur cluster assembly protein
MELLEKQTELNVLPVAFTDEAIREVKRLIVADSIPQDHGLRVGVKGGGCSGMTYVLGFDARQEGDEEYQIEDVRVFMNKSHQLYLFGMQIHYENGLNSRGFVFQNPNAKKTCGCGTSFSA